MMSLLSPTLPRGPINLGSRLRLLPDSSLDFMCIEEMPGWQILHTPGHTPGHVSLLRLGDRTLLPGDAFCTTKPESFFDAAITQPSELHGPPAYFTSDWGAARKSVQRLAAVKPLTVAPGHGRPVAGATVATLLDGLAARFDEIAVPDNKREPAA
jgi:glyoxylase-like metal-dependent hydrolase (beta-lactamase superfamily II)